MIRLLFSIALLSVVSAVNATELPDFTKLVEQQAGAVVNISTTQKSVRGKLPDFSLPGLPDSPQFEQFHDFLKRLFEQQGVDPEMFESQSLGSGFIVSKDGYILTNAHVVEGADEILVRLQDRREFEARIIGIDELSDLALLKIGAKSLPVVKLGSSKDLKVGEWVMAIGNPYGFGHTVTAGIVSAKGRSFRDENYTPFIQTDVAINLGNSGGPLFNTRGEVVGINSRITSGPGQRSYIGLSFAIPIDVAKDVMDQLKTDGHVSRGWLGVLIQEVTPELAGSFGLSRPQGALVAKVLDEGPAKAAGVQVGDVILEFNGQKIHESSDLPPLVGRVRAGKKASLTILRQGKQIKIHLKIGKLPDKPGKQAQTRQQTDQLDHGGRLGLTVEDLDAGTIKQSGADHGVIVTKVADGSPANIGLRTGDIIQMIDNRKIENVAGFNKVVDGLKPGSSVAILVYRETGPVFLAMRVPD